MKKLSCFTAFLIAVLFIFSDSNILSQQSRVSEELFKDLYPDFQVSSPDYYYMPSEPVVFKIQSQSIPVPALFSIKIYRIKDPGLFLSMQSGYQQFSVIGKDSSNLLDLLEEVYSLDKTLLPQRMENSDALWINRELNFTPKRNGAYLVRVNHKGKIASCGFFVTAISILSRFTEGSILNYTCSRKTGEPVDSIKHTLYFNSIKAGEQFSSGSVQNYYYTDSDKELLRKNSYCIPFIISQKNDDIAVSDPNYYFFGSFQPYNAIIITSQPVYRPPGKVDFKITLREKTVAGYEIYSKKNAVVKIKDPKGAGIYRKRIITDDFGGFSDSIFIDKEAPLGSYTISLDITKDNDSTDAGKIIYQSFSQSFAVEEYKKPEYKAEIKTDKEQYGNGEKIEIDIQSDYYFGSPVPDAEVTYNIYKKPLYRPWWYYSEYSWFYKDYYSTITETDNYENSQYIFTEKGKLDENGNLKVTYQIDEDFNDGTKKDPRETDYMYIVSVNVVDKSRSNVSGVKTVNVTRSDYFISAHTDKYITKPGEKIGLIVNARDFADKPVEADYSVSVYQIIYEKKVRIQNFLTTLAGKTSYLGDDIIYLQTEPEGYYEIEVTSFDSKNTKLKEVTGCYVSSGKMTWWERDESIINILPEKDSYFPGDTAVAFVEVPHDDEANLLISGYNKSVVYYSVEKITGGSAYLKIPVSDNCAPNFYINVTYIRDGKIYTNTRSLAVIPKNKFLDVSLSSDKPVYKPREEGEITVTVKDALGNPVKNSEITLGIIDESIYAIAPENIKDIRSIFFPVVTDKSSFTYNRANIYSQSGISAFPKLLEMYNAASPENKIAEVTAELYTERGEKFNNIGVIIDNKYLAGYAFNEGKMSFTLPEGEYNVSLIYKNKRVRGDYRIKFTQAGPNILQIKTSSENILFAELNKDLLIAPELKKGSGKIHGTVRDYKGNLLVGARVEIEGTIIRTGTDEKGSYTITGLPVGVYSVKCSYVGFESMIFKSISIEDDDSKKLDFEMSMGGVVLDTVMIVGKRKTIDNGSGKIIGTEFIDNTGIKGIENITSKTSGIVTDEIGQNINLRGGRTNETQIIIDGVVTNNNSAEYGDILSGVINVTGKNDFVEAVTRTEFKDAVLWVPSAYTDENGVAKVKVKFPDNLTSWRVTARVVSKQTDVGQNNYSITERKDLIIRVETPRFFQQNDEVTVSTIVHNYLEEEKTAKVTMKLDNLTLLNNTSGEQLITLGKNEEKRVDWLVKVNNPVGIGNVTASALTNEESDAMQQLIPLQPFGLKVTKHNAFDLTKTSGSITKHFSLPLNTDLRSSNLLIGISPSIASSILGSLEYLIGYPYGCIEQTMSRFMPTVITANTLKDLGAPEDPYFAGQIPKMVQKGLDKIYSLQKSDGGWGWWGNAAPDPYMSAYVMYGLELAKQNGYKVSSKYLKKGNGYLKNSLGNKKMENTSRAFVTFVLAGTDNDPKTIKLLDKQFTALSKKETSSLAKALLSLAAGKMLKAGTQQKYITDVMREVNYIDDDKAFWGGKIKKYKWQNDDIITTAIVLKALLADTESAKDNRDIIEKAVNWLLSVKKVNAWGNTLQNAFIIYSLTDYLRTYNELEPDYSIKISVNGRPSIEKHITKDDVFKKEDKFIVTGDMFKTGDNEILIEKSGAGKTYFTSAVTYYESENKKEIAGTYNGFDVEREYYELKKVFDPKKKVYTYQKIDFNGTVTSGSELLVKIKVYPKEPANEYFMLEDPIPAGCEYIKEDWAYPIDEENSYQNRSRALWNWWYDDQDIRDNRVAFFASSVDQQEYVFSYLLRALVPGTYNIMPSVGTLMYYPEVNGSGENNVLKIIDKK